VLQPATTPGRFIQPATDRAPAIEIAARVSPSVPCDVSWSPAAGGLCEVVLHVNGAAGTRIEEVALALSPAGATQTLLSRQARVLLLGGFEVTGRGAADLGTRLDEAQGTVTLSGLGAVFQDAGFALLLGAGFPNADFGAVTTDGRQLTLTFRPGRTLGNSEEFRVLLGTADTAGELLAAYGASLGRHARPVREVPTGWNSWDYYQGGITMDACRAEMAAINASPLRGKLKHFVIDMGWENCWGDWRPNRRFPEDPAQIAGEIKAAGFSPGIWLAPLQASTYLPWLREERDCFCRNADGDPIVTQGHGTCLLFDPTHPRTVQWLHDTCTCLREAGFELFKIDYLYRSYFDSMATLHDPTVGKAAAARRFLEIIRGAIGDDAHLLSCGAPMPCALGLADSARISTDIHNFWGHVRNAGMQVAASQWLNGHAWVNDPDFAIIRSRETSADPFLNPPHGRRPYADPKDFWMAGDDASFTELQTWLNLCHVCGGSLVASDSIARLNARGVAALQHLLDHPAPAPGVPLDLMDATPPGVWLATDGARSSLGVFNWDDEPAEIELPGNTPAEGADYWTGARVSLGRSVRLPGRGSMVVRF
jgi:hypothetical protein